MFSLTIFKWMGQRYENAKYLNQGHKMQSSLHTYHIHLNWLDVVRLCLLSMQKLPIPSL